MPQSTMAGFYQLYLSPIPCLLVLCTTEPAAGAARDQVARCDFSDVPGAVWWGPQRRMPIVQLASYLAPVYWFSPDEPLMNRTEGAEIRIPEAMPFEPAPDAPVVYYQLEELVLNGSGPPAYFENPDDKNGSIVDLERAGTLKMGFFAYFRSEEGLGAHPHDIEAAEFKVGVLRNSSEYVQEHTKSKCDQPYYVLAILRVTAKAHGVFWYWNILDVDAETRFPLFLLVEEGKHALATDKNSDGYYTPGYDVTRHVNDAWGVRDVIRSGLLFSSTYSGWMTKVRHPEHRVFPPLPGDSPLRAELKQRGAYLLPYVEYQLRPLPPAKLSAYDPSLYRFMKDKEVPGWPEIHEATTVEDLLDWVDEGAVVKSLAIAFRTDGELGFSFVFPLFILKNFEDPVSGGFLVHRIYLKDAGLRDFGWMLMYTPSASRWIDTYVAAGAEWNSEAVAGVRQRTRDFVFETGLKLRANLSSTPLRFLGCLTDFWGIRIGIKNRGFFNVHQMTYVIEVGAGVW